MKPKIRNFMIGLSYGLNEIPDLHVGIERWTGNPCTEAYDNSFQHAIYFHVTPASIARCRRMQDKMTGRVAAESQPVRLPKTNWRMGFTDEQLEDGDAKCDERMGN